MHIHEIFYLGFFFQQQNLHGSLIHTLKFVSKVESVEIFEFEAYFVDSPNLRNKLFCRAAAEYLYISTARVENLLFTNQNHAHLHTLSTSLHYSWLKSKQQQNSE